MKKAKLAEELDVSDFSESKVWTFVDEDGRGESLVRPITKVPVRELDGCIVGCEVMLACGKKVWALIGNVSSKNVLKTKHFITFTFFHKGERIHLARYHDPDYRRNGPESLAAFLEMKAEEVFPITYDLSAVCLGIREALAGKVELSPKEKLSDDQRMALIFEP